MRTLPKSSSDSHQVAVSGKPMTSSRSEEHTSELQSRSDLVCRLLLEKKKKKQESSTKDKAPTKPKQQSAEIINSYTISRTICTTAIAFSRTLTLHCNMYTATRRDNT